MDITTDVYINREFEKCYFHCILLNLNISFDYGGILMKIAGHVVHLEGTVSHILYLDPSFYFRKSRKLS